jgi:hypothetical protein
MQQIFIVTSSVLLCITRTMLFFLLIIFSLFLIDIIFPVPHSVTDGILKYLPTFSFLKANHLNDYFLLVLLYMYSDIQY